MGEIHGDPSPMAGKIVKIKSGEFKDELYRVEDWWDRVSGMSWMVADGNPACLNYAIRGATDKLPIDNEVLYGKIELLGHLIHESEIGIVLDQYYFTFGQIHETKDGVGLKDFWVRVIAPSYDDARAQFCEIFTSEFMVSPDKWAFQYDHERFEKYRPSFPKGEYALIANGELVRIG